MYRKTIHTALFLSALFLTACETASPIVFPRGPAVQPFADNHDWLILREYVYEIDGAGSAIRIPAGFVTDFASIPQALWSLGFSPNGRYSRAALIHDFLYWSQSCTREQADNIFLLAMRQSKVSSVDQKVVYLGVRAGGAAPWAGNAAEKESGLPRTIPKGYWSDIPADATWSDFRKTLQSSRVSDPAWPKDPAYCKAGDKVQLSDDK